MSDFRSDSDNTLSAQICEIVADTLGIDGGVTPNQTFQSLGADSIDMATLIVTLQDEFPAASELDESALVNIQTAGEVAEFVKTQINN